MTNLEALQARITYPLPENTFRLALIDRGIMALGEYSGLTQAFELAVEDCLRTVVNSPNVTEGGYSVSQTEKVLLLAAADKISDKYSNTVKTEAKFVQKW